MPFKCNVVNCKGNYNKDLACSVYTLPKDSVEKQKWINVIPAFQHRKASIENFRLCRNHWPEDTPIIKVRGSYTRPALPPSIFNVPASSMQTPKPLPRKLQQWLNDR